ncbi:MAG: hypothetical protein KA791_09415 [Flavobacteriales bacterium]|nr:hypothetical protein [Flavobacteriales bacterium]
MSDKSKNLMDQAFAALLSDDDAKVLGAIAYVQERGDARAIFPLLHALARTTDHQRQQKIHELLYEVKVKDAAAELARALDESALRGVRKTVIATFWNAGLDTSPYTDKLIDCAVEGTAEECFECLTVLENQEVLPEKAVLRGIKEVSKAIAANTDDYKGAMLGSLLVELKARVGKD